MSISWRLFTFMLLFFLQLQASQAIWFPWYYRHYGLEPHSSRHAGAAKTTGGTTPAARAATGKGAAEPIATITTTKTPTAASQASQAAQVTCPPGYQLREKDTVTCPPGYQLKNKAGAIIQSPDSRLCDDNPLVMQLARLYVVSPERVVLLLAQPQIQDSCVEVIDVLDHIQSITSNCILAEDNIYGKLADGVKYYREEVCDGGGNKKRSTRLSESHCCLKDLRTDMIECEAQADWYENRNATKVCQTFNDILDCFYIRGAMLCGLDAAAQLRSFAGDSMKRALVQPCEVNKRLPRVSEAMPVLSASESKCSFLISTNFYFFTICSAFNVYLYLRFK